MTCSLSKEFSLNGTTAIENSFIIEYLPTAPGDAVKVYLYGLFLCKNEQYDIPLDEIAKNLGLTSEQVIDSFKFWQDYDLVSVTEEPFSVIYQPISSGYGKAKKYKPEKYTEFCAVLQSLIKGRPISVNEFGEYFSIMEVYGIKQDAMLMIVSNCVAKKGDDIGYRYIAKVAKDFGARGLTTVEKVETEFGKYLTKTADIERILKAMNSTKQPEVENLKHLNKWINEMNFTLESIIFSASTLKKGSFEKLDAFLTELYGLKCFTIEEISRHAEKKKDLFETSVLIAKALSLYFEVIDTVVDNYTSKWFEFGYDRETLIFIANYCFKQGKNTLDNMDKIIEYLFKNGVISFTAVSEYFLKVQKDDDFIKELLSSLGLKREVTPWDRNNLRLWREWNFSDEMILFASKKASGKSSPIPYLNSILGNWKTKHIYTVADAENEERKEKSTSTLSSNALVVTVQEVSSEYEKLRYKATKKMEENLSKAETISGFSKNYKRLNEIDIELAMSEFSGKKDTVLELEEEKKLVKEKVLLALNEVNLTLDDLKPQYKCKKCNDTGFDGINKCSCYDETVNKIKKAKQNAKK